MERIHSIAVNVSMIAVSMSPGLTTETQLPDRG